VKTKEELYSLIDQNESIQFLQRLVQINSVNPPGGEKVVAEVIQAFLQDSGLALELDDLGDERANILVQYSLDQRAAAGDKVLVYSGHLDTVPPGNIKWKYGPFSGQKVEDRIYGRGTTDMKSGVAAMLLAMKYLQQTGVKLQGQLRFVGTAGEEVDGYGAKQVVKKGQVDDATAMVISEPSANQVFVAHKGALWLELTTYGKTAHGSMPEHGINAISAMNHFLSALESYTFTYEPHPILGGPTLNVGTIQGGVKTNVVPDQCTTTLDIRSVPGQDHAQIADEIIQLLKNACEKTGAACEWRVMNDMASIATPKDDAFIQLAVQTAKEHFSRTLEPRGVNYYTDGSVYGPHLKHVPILIFGPGEPTLAHQPDEYVEIEKFMAAIQYFMVFAMAYLGVEE
jgi:succinyl-diaminopimelate desuccinylase